MLSTYCKEVPKGGMAKFRDVPKKCKLHLHVKMGSEYAISTTDSEEQRDGNSGLDYALWKIYGCSPLLEVILYGQWSFWGKWFVRCQKVRGFTYLRGCKNNTIYI